jgi:GSH-dependent disulfide-bond oxidoreductase
VEKAISVDLPLIYGYLDEQVGSRAFLAGERFSIADVASASFFRSMQQAGVAPDATHFPNLTRYVAQQHSRPANTRGYRMPTAARSPGASHSSPGKPWRPAPE